VASVLYFGKPLDSVLIFYISQSCCQPFK